MEGTVMRKIKQILKVLIVIAICWWIFTSLAYNFLWSYTPTFDTYEEQKNFAYNKLLHIANNDFAVSFFWRWYWSSKLKSYLTVERLYPEKAENDIDILRWIATCYTRLGNYEKALPYYQKELEVFREKYFGKDYPEKRIFKPDDRYLAVKEEYKRIIQIHNNIATC
jgi:tetratricopeptide (TPR) repeat protein